jgi:hypothetical protein
MSDTLLTALIAALDDDALDALAGLLAPRLRLRLEADGQPSREQIDGYLRPGAAARYIGAKSAKRIYDLKSAGALEPDGYDGRAPLFLRETLDAYVRSRTR